MLEDCYDFYYNSMKRITINQYVSVMDYKEKIYKGKWPVKNCISILETIEKIQEDLASNPNKIEEVKKQYEEYKETAQYKEWLKNLEEKDEEHYIRGDNDPEGWALYIKTLEDPKAAYLDYAEKIFLLNPESKDL